MTKQASWLASLVEIVPELDAVAPAKPSSVNQSLLRGKTSAIFPKQLCCYFASFNTKTSRPKQARKPKDVKASDPKTLPSSTHPQRQLLVDPVCINEF